MSTLSVNTTADQVQVHPLGSQGYRCQECGCRYTPEPKVQGHTGETRALAVRMVLEGMSFRAIGRVLKVSAQSVGNQAKAYANGLPAAPLPPRDTEPCVRFRAPKGLPEDIDIAELDELCTYIASKKPVYLVTVVHCATRCIIGWEVVAERTNQRQYARLATLLSANINGNVTNSH